MIIDATEMVAIRFNEIKERGWKVGKKEAEGISRICDLSFDALLMLRDGISSLGMNSDKALTFAMEIDDIERKIDNFYINTDIEIVTGKMDLPAILIVRDALHDVEKISDKVGEAAELIRILAL